MSRRGARATVEVEIAGERHVLRSDATPEYTRAVAAHVDAVLRRADASVLEPYRSAVLAALFITDELFRTRDELRRLRTELDQRSNALAHLLERAAASGVAPDEDPAPPAPVPGAPAAGGNPPQS